MLADPSLPHTLCWTGPQHAPLLGELLDQMIGLAQPVGIGGPRDPAVDALARAHDLAPADDLRKLLIDHPQASVLITATCDAIAPADLRLAAEQSVQVLCLEPFAHDLPATADLDKRKADQPAPIETLQLAPAFIHRSTLTPLVGPDDLIGSPRVLRITQTGPASDASLFARLLDAWLAALKFVDLPESVFATLVGDGAQGSLRRLTGQLAAVARTPDQGLVTLFASDLPEHPHTRRIDLQGPEGLAHATDQDYHLIHHENQFEDTGQASLPAHAPPSDTYAGLIAQQWCRILAEGLPTNAATPRLTAYREALACCLASQLSVRTGQPESPQTILRMGL